MEASVVDQAPVEVKAEAEVPDHIFKWSDWVHVGPGAEECKGIVRDDDDRIVKVDCPHETADTPITKRHFHAWLRLPNQFAYRDITEKAQAARARKQRQLRDPDSDAHAVLEDQLENLRGNPEGLIEELVYSKYGDDEEAREAALADERFEHIEQDREELARMLTVPESDRNADELATLERHVESFDKAVDAALERIRTRRRESLATLPMDELIDQGRRLRIERVGVTEHWHVSAYWVWYIGTMKPIEGSTERKFANVNVMLQAPSEIITALQMAFAVLEGHLTPVRRSVKNS